MAFFQVVMNKAFKNLVVDRTEVSVDTGLRAAEKLLCVLDRRDQGIDVFQLKGRAGRIIEAVRSVVPQSMWGEIAEKLDQPEHSESLDVGTDV